MTNDAAARYRAARNTVLGLLPKGGVGAEIGVWKGDFAETILRHRAPARLHLIDPWAVSDAEHHRTALYGRARGADMDAIYDGVAERFASTIAAGQVVLHRAASQEAMAGFATASLDFVYVDGDHSHDAVRADLEAALRVVKPGGRIALDDYAVGKWWDDDVIRATNGFIGDHRGEVAILFAATTQVLLLRR